MPKINLSVSVPFPVLEGQFVCVTGSSTNLGSWVARDAIKLKKVKDGLWVGDIYLIEPTHFIYFIGTNVKTEKANKKVLAVFRWEELSKPRCLTYSGTDRYESQVLYHIFGEEGNNITDNNATNGYQIALKTPGNLCRKRKLEDNVEIGTQREYIKQLEADKDLLIKTMEMNAKTTRHLSEQNLLLAQQLRQYQQPRQYVQPQQRVQQQMFQPQQYVRPQQMLQPQQCVQQQYVQPQQMQNNYQQQGYRFYQPQQMQNCTVNYMFMQQEPDFANNVISGTGATNNICTGADSSVILSNSEGETDSSAAPLNVLPPRPASIDLEIIKEE